MTQNCGRQQGAALPIRSYVTVSGDSCGCRDGSGEQAATGAYGAEVRGAAPHPPAHGQPCNKELPSLKGQDS